MDSSQLRPVSGEDLDAVEVFTDVDGHDQLAKTGQILAGDGLRYALGMDHRSEGGELLLADALETRRDR